MAITDLMAPMLKSMGFDPQTILAQASQLGAMFENLTRTQGEIQAQLAALQAGQLAVMAAMGLYVPPADESMVQLIADESSKHIARVERVSHDARVERVSHDASLEAADV